MYLLSNNDPVMSFLVIKAFDRNNLTQSIYKTMAHELQPSYDQSLIQQRSQVQHKLSCVSDRVVLVNIIKVLIK